jgi:hypothetical protein
LFGPDNDLFVVSETANAVLRYDGTTGAFIDDFVMPGSGGAMNPRGKAQQVLPTLRQELNQALNTLAEWRWVKWTRDA